MQLHVCTALPASPGKQAIIGIEFIIERQIICLIRSCGQILCHDPQTGSCEVAAVTSAGIYAASWSPDQDVLLIAQDDERLVVYTQFFELLSDTNLNPAEKGCAESVNVGWGSKETQFHGSEGKAAARLKQQVIE
jgi:elongator complex protein 1